MKFSRCNEMFEDKPMAEVCATAKKLGYHGLEVVGLHWLYVGVEGMHMTSPDDKLWTAARNYLEELVGMCADMNGKVLVIGSPNQRSVTEGQAYEDAWLRARDLFGSVLYKAADRDVTLCVEPLAPAETDFLNTAAEGVKMVNELNHPNFKVHLEVKAMSNEPTGGDVPEIIKATKSEYIGHFHVNDPNLYGPDMGDIDYEPVAEAINEVGWDKWLSVEVFKYDPETIAKQSIECLKKYW